MPRLVVGLVLKSNAAFHCYIYRYKEDAYREGIGLFDEIS